MARPGALRKGRVSRRAPQRRRQERATLLQTWAKLLVRSCVRALMALGDRLPAAWLEPIGALFGACAYHALGSLRRQALRHTALALEPARARIVARRCFSNAGRHLALSLLLRRTSTRASELLRVPQDALSTLRAALAEGRGAIVVSAHIGPFELIPAALEELGVATAIVVRESHDPALDSLIDAHRHARCSQVIHRGAAGAASRIVHALAAGKALGLLPDIGASVESRPALLCGRRVLLPVGPQRLALRLRLPMLVCVLQPRARGPGRDSQRFSLSIRRLPTAADEAGATELVASALSESILRAPEHWLWMAAGREPGPVPG
jgi:Kdo2-lipid IVA lauroyltransferase/acyltransferase